MFELRDDWTLEAYTRIVEEMTDEDLADEMADAARQVLNALPIDYDFNKRKLLVVLNEHDYRNSND